MEGLSDLNCASFPPFVRMYPIKEVPVEAEALSDWLYQRFVEKEELLAHFYDTGLSDIPASLGSGSKHLSAERFCSVHRLGTSR